jgi:hypothetical protein
MIIVETDFKILGQLVFARYETISNSFIYRKKAYFLCLGKGLFQSTL